MANELAVRAFLHFAKGNVDESMAVGVSLTVTGTKCVKKTQAIGFAEAEALDVGDMTTPGWFLMWNTDATNYVEIRDGAAGADLLKLKAGEIAMGRLATTTPYALANTAGISLYYIVVED